MKTLQFAMRVVTIACVCALSLGIAFAQNTNSGDIRGTVTDPSGALISGATVTVVNVNTGITKVLQTNKAGLYDTSSIVVGTYSVTFEKPGFERFERSSISLEVGTSTVNATLKIGSTNEEVVVSADLPLLETETGEQKTTLDAKSMSLLPNVGQDWQSFAILVPGTAGTPQGSQGATNPGDQVSANGALPYSNVLADGSSTTLSTSGNSDVSIFETVAEVQISTSAFSAQYGIGGIIFNQISKGGANKFHGSLYNYFQSDQLNAFPYNTTGSTITKPYLRFNNFGGSIGGPVLIPKLFNGHDKVFFYFNYDQTVNHGSASNATNSIPTPDVMGGNFAGQSMIYDPTTQVIEHDAKGNPYPVRQSFQSEYGSNAVPTALFDKVAANFQKFYPTPTNHLAGGQFITGNYNGQGILQNNFYSSVPQSTPDRRYFGRLDYDITKSNRLTASVTQRDNPAVTPNGVTECPVQCGNQDIESYNSQITDVWTISPRMVNEARFGYTYQGNFFSDQTLGKNYPEQLGWQFAKADEIPGIQFVTNYPYAWIEPNSGQFIYKEHAFDPSDVVTMIRGKHVIHFGGEVLIYRDDNTPYSYIQPGTLQFSGQYTQHWSLNAQGIASPDSGTGVDYADFLLGYAQNWGASVQPEYGARLKTPQVFVQDDYKIRPNLTLNLGLRYQIRDGFNEVHGNEATYDPTVNNPANNTPGAYWYGTTAANGRKSLQASNYNSFLPRVGFSWLPNQNMTIRGGFGIYAYNLSLDAYGGGMGAALGSSGNASDQTNGITPAVILDSSGANLPYSTASTSPTRFNGQTVTYTQYHVPTPQIYQYNLATQQTIGPNMVFELAYVGSHGFNLNFPTNINQVPTQFLGTNDSQFVPNTNFQQINGSTNNAISNYNSLQASVSRRLSSGLSFNFNYVWSHFLDDQDSSAFGSRAGRQYYQYNTPAQNYSNSNFDVRNAFKGNAVYELPVGRGRKFLNNNSLLDAILGGYQISGTIQLTSGNPFSVYAANANSYAQPGNGSATVFPNYTGAPLHTPGTHTLAEWFNPAAFSQPDNGTFGNVRRNSVYGPGIELINLSGGKKFTLHDQIKLQIRADATNALNHANFGVPQEQLTGLQPGSNIFSAGGTNALINTVSGGARNVQLGARLEF
jgi:Carboxypeptidase regulatory-like domain